MRATINIDEALLRAARQRAAERGTTLSAVIADALHAHLAGGGGRVRRPFKLIVFRGDGVWPGIDLDQPSALTAADDVAQFGEAKQRR